MQNNFLNIVKYTGSGHTAVSEVKDNLLNTSPHEKPLDTARPIRILLTIVDHLPEPQEIKSGPCIFGTRTPCGRFEVPTVGVQEVLANLFIHFNNLMERRSQWQSLLPACVSWADEYSYLPHSVSCHLDIVFTTEHEDSNR